MAGNNGQTSQDVCTDGTCGDCNTCPDCKNPDCLCTC
jgi:hypothetical protein